MRRLSRGTPHRTSAAVPDLFDMKLRALRRDRASHIGPELFLAERTFEDIVERITLQRRRFGRALLIGFPDPAWPGRLNSVASEVDARDPGELFAGAAGGQTIVEDATPMPNGNYDLVLAIGTLDTVNELPRALLAVRQAMAPDGLFIGAFSGGETVPRLRAAMRAADAVAGTAAPHVHPRIEASAFAPLLELAGFVQPVVDIDRVPVSYSDLGRLIGDLRAMAATNLLVDRPRSMTKAARAAAFENFAQHSVDGRTVETFEIVHFAAWADAHG